MEKQQILKQLVFKSYFRYENSFFVYKTVILYVTIEICLFL